MHDPKSRLKVAVDASLAFCRSWLIEDDAGGLRLVDPIDNKPIPAHYGDSHLAAALIILGKLRDENALVEQGIQITKTIILGWDNAKKLSDFHHDFNHFALCLVDEHLRDTERDISREIRKIIISTDDSRHDTINWLPMRAYVNRTRYEWTGEKQYQENADRCVRRIAEATNNDGGIEDRLPIGSSFNLQYNVSSLAALLFLKGKWEEMEYDFVRGFEFLLDRVLPDGDINYVGRGTNQIFAWGPWLYALSSADHTQLLQALEFVNRRYSSAGNNGNILLNEFPGEEKLFWWDYHFCSVYHAHFLLWSVLALAELNVDKKPDLTTPRSSHAATSSRETTTGLSILRGGSWGAVVFSGRSIYLAESGPTLCALWDYRGNVLFKGGLGPWQGSFGRTHAFADSVFLNHFGLISQRAPRSFFDNRLAKKMNWKYAEKREAIVQAEFGALTIEFEDDSARITIRTDEVSGYFNAPLLGGSSAGSRVDFMVDGRKLQSIVVGKFKNQYGWTNAIRSIPARGSRWQVTISQDRTLK